MDKNERTIHLLGQDITYTLKRSKRARNVRISIRPGGESVVSAPRWALVFQIEQVLRSKAAWIVEKVAEMRARPVVVKQSKAQVKAEFEQYKEAARELVEARLAHFNQHYGPKYGLRYGTIRIGRQKTRWGSCSKAGNLSFNYKIAMLEPALADYIVVHELCHVREFNHGAAFWALVAEMVPEYKAARAALKGAGRVVG